MTSSLHKRAMLVVAAIAALSFLAAFGYAVFVEPNPERPTAGANTFSYSAIGHKAVVEVLRDIGRPVTVSYWQTGARAADSAVLVVAEPDALRDAMPMIARARTALLVLPKWYGYEDDKQHWVDDVSPRYMTVPWADDYVLQTGATTGWRSHVGPTPTLSYPQLLVAGDGMTPVIWSDDGVLLGYRDLGDTRLWVLSDPDVLNNHGIGRGSNAELAVAIIDTIRGGNQPVLWDETIHGFIVKPKLGASLLRFPLVLVTAQLALVALLGIWAGAVRFGSPVRKPAAQPAGHVALVDRSSSLLIEAGHAAHMLRRYLAAAERDVAERVHHDPGGSELEQLRADVGAVKSRQRKRVVAAAQRIERWRKDQLDGRSHRSNHD